MWVLPVPVSPSRTRLGLVAKSVKGRAASGGWTGLTLSWRTVRVMAESDGQQGRLTRPESGSSLPFRGRQESVSAGRCLITDLIGPHQTRGLDAVIQRLMSDSCQPVPLTL